MKTLSERIKEARSFAGYTQQELADISGVKQRQIARYEAGDAAPRDRVLKKIADACFVSFEKLKQPPSDTIEVMIPPAFRKQIIESAKNGNATIDDVMSVFIQRIAALSDEDQLEFLKPVNKTESEDPSTEVPFDFMLTEKDLINREE